MNMINLGITKFNDVSSLFKFQIHSLAKGDLEDYATGFVAAFVVTALKIGSWNLLATSGAVVAYNRSAILINDNIKEYCPLSISSDSKVKTICKVVPFVFAAAVYTGVSSLSLYASLITLGSAVLVNGAIKIIDGSINLVQSKGQPKGL